MKKQILLIGIGQFGSMVADSYAKLQSGDSITVFAVDTDMRSLEDITAAHKISVFDDCRISDILEATDPELINGWFPCDREKDCVEYFETLGMNEGANQWRMKALLSFYNYLSNEKNKEEFHSLLSSVAEKCKKDSEGEVELFFTASLSGGTGSGLLLPLNWYLKRFFEENGVKVSLCRCALVMPDVLEDGLTAEQKIKARANAYATLKELEAIDLTAFGKLEGTDFKLGASDDPVFGVLYDSEDESAKSSANIPFSQVFLFKRLPGVWSPLTHVHYIADSIKTLLARNDSSEAPECEAVYGVFSMAKTVYPKKAVGDYLEKATLSEIANSQWLPFFNDVAKKLSALRGVSYTVETADAETVPEITAAVKEAVEAYCPGGESLSRIMGRKNDPAAPEGCFDAEYFELLDGAFEGEFATDASTELKEALENAKKTVADNTKKSKLFGRSKRRKEVLSLISVCKSRLEEYYALGIDSLEDAPLAAKRIMASGGALDFEKRFFKNGKKAANPIYGLVLLCSLYDALAKFANEARRAEKEKIDLQDKSMIPMWVLAADYNITADCGYDTGDITRLYSVFYESTDHVGSKPEDMSLFAFDADNAFTTLSKIFKLRIAEGALRLLEERISALYNGLYALKCGFAELDEDVKDAESAYGGRPGIVYYAGASKAEKKILFARLISELTSEEDYVCMPELDGCLADAVKKLSVITDLKTAKKKAAELSRGMVTAVSKNQTVARFEKVNLDKNILEILLTRDGVGGSDDSELAIKKALCSVTHAMRFNLPDTKDSYKIVKNMRQSVTAILPAAAKKYLKDRAEDFEGMSPEKIMAELLIKVGEYDAVACFDPSVAANELRLVKKTVGLRLSMFENMARQSEIPTYYKSYCKALMMCREQCTDMWAPHLSRSIDPERLPEPEDQITNVRKENEPC